MTDLLTETCLADLHQYQRLYIGFSGGLDSTVLLHQLASHSTLHGRLIAVHINHDLSPYASVWQKHCQIACDALNIPLIVQSVEFDRHANIEEGARVARLNVFSALLENHDGLLFAHHANDQAETLLLQLIRGAGIDGMAAMPVLKKMGQGVLIRPFLSLSQQMLKDYAVRFKLSWIEDDSNQNEHYSRNYLRHQIMPLLQKRWPSVVNNMARSANHCQQAMINLNTLARMDCDMLNGALSSLSLSNLYKQSPVRVANVLRVWFKENHLRMPSSGILNRILDEIIFSSLQTDNCVAWGKVSVRCYQDTLYLVKEDLIVCTNIEWTDFPSDLFLNDRQTYLRANLALCGLRIPESSAVSVRFRQGNDFIRLRGQTKSLKKLFQEWRIPSWLRARIPLIYINDCLAAVVGYAINDDYYAVDGDNIYSIEL